jgi:hypothetical protein
LSTPFSGAAGSDTLLNPRINVLRKPSARTYAELDLSGKLVLGNLSEERGAPKAGALKDGGKPKNLSVHVLSP